MAAPQKFVAHLVQHQYHPRSNKHGVALCDYVLEDLLAKCPKIAADVNIATTFKVAAAASPDGAQEHCNAGPKHGWNLEEHPAPRVAGQPAPQTGDPLHYDSFLHRICDRYSQRWA